jgi:hypothetical protein
MRLWSLHPSYLDAKGLTACWREGLLARKVLQGKTKGYKHHPQLDRFRAQADPVAAVDGYLLGIWEEAARRGFRFTRGKIGAALSKGKINVADGQLDYELRHLKAKLKVRDKSAFNAIAALTKPLPHPAFKVVKGSVELWEKQKLRRQPS